MKNFKKIFSFAVIFLVFCVCSLVTYKIVRWKMYIWLPGYIAGQLRRADPEPNLIHIIFLMVDHYEPGRGEKGAKVNQEWLDRYKELASRHKDSYGRVPQHSWFYAYEQKNELVMPELVRAVRDGYGEIEFHWHHGNDNNAEFPAKLAEGVAWFNRYGAMIDAQGKKSFAFIHGNWSLDNSGGREFCGVTRELEILKSLGCYGDFTFPAFGNIAQPRKVNSIYYASDDDQSKSYDTGIGSKVGSHNDKDLMIFEGPITIKDYGAIEIDPFPDHGDIDSLIKANVHVSGRPEWVFVKTFTHGVQSRKIFFDTVVDDIFSYLEMKYKNDKYKLHYVTAREAYNIVSAAEDGMGGDPNLYLNYKINKPVSALID